MHFGAAAFATAPIMFALEASDVPLWSEVLPFGEVVKANITPLHAKLAASQITVRYFHRSSNIFVSPRVMENWIKLLSRL